MGGPFVVVGGGPCGLAAAWELARRGLKPVVLEAEALVGGLCATYAQDGYRFDLGGHRFVSSDERLSTWLVSLLGDDLLTQERKSVVLHAGRAFRYPLDAKDLLSKLPLRQNAEALAGYLAVRADRALRPERYPDRTFEDWVIARFGVPLYRTFFGPYTEKLWGRSPREISADWAAERISLLHLGDAALRMAGIARPEIRTYARRYQYPRRGMGQLYEAMAKEVRSLGGEIHLQARVVGVETSGDRVTAIKVEKADRTAYEVPVGELLSTMPLPQLARSLSPDLPGPARAAAERLKFRGLTFLNLGLTRAEVSENTWMYVADGNLRISRIQEPKRRSLSMAPPDRTSLMLEMPSDPGDEIWQASDRELETRARRELVAANVQLKVDEIATRFSVRVAHGYPVYHLGYDADRRTLFDVVDRFVNVRTAGRQGLFRYIFMDAAMQMGIRAADEMASGQRPRTSDADRIATGRSVIETSALTA